MQSWPMFGFQSMTLPWTVHLISPSQCSTAETQPVYTLSVRLKISWTDLFVVYRKQSNLFLQLRHFAWKKYRNIHEQQQPKKKRCLKNVREKNSVLERQWLRSSTWKDGCKNVLRAYQYGCCKYQQERSRKCKAVNNYSFQIPYPLHCARDETSFLWDKRAQRQQALPSYPCLDIGRSCASTKKPLVSEVQWCLCSVCCLRRRALCAAPAVSSLLQWGRNRVNVFAYGQ